MASLRMIPGLGMCGLKVQMEGWLFGVLRGRGRNNTLSYGDCDALILILQEFDIWSKPRYY